MTHYKLALLGFGNVGKALARLMLLKQEEMQASYGVTFSITGIATGRHGMLVNPAGIDLQRALDEGLQAFPGVSALDGPAFIRSSGADVLFENSPVNYDTGQPALDYIRMALEAGMSVATANKGPVVHAYRELTELAASRGRKFYFESAVMDGAPIFSLFRETLPAARLLRFRGVLNSTTNLILTRMEGGETFEDAVRHAQSIGIAETDPSGDIDGWDAAVKVSALATVLMGASLRPQQVERQGIRSITPADVARARQEGKRWKLVCQAEKNEAGVRGKVFPEMVLPESSLYNVMGTSSTITFETDVLGALTIIETNPGPETTAYGLLADFLNIARK